MALCLKHGIKSAYTSRTPRPDRIQVQVTLCPGDDECAIELEVQPKGHLMVHAQLDQPEGGSCNPHVCR